MKSKRLSFNKIKFIIIIILIIFSEIFIMHEISSANDRDIEITEIMYNPGDSNDWFEIFNKGEEKINLKDLYLIDEFNLVNSGEKYLYCHSVNKNEYLLEPGEYIIVGKNKGTFSVSSLNLNGVNEDAIRLSLDNCKTFISELTYNPKENKTKKEYSLELDKGGFLRESVNEGGSPGEKNPEKEIVEEVEEGENNDNMNESNTKKEYKHTIRINELLPSPAGKDDEGEYIELYNFGKEDIDLGEDGGWLIEDRVGSEKENPNENKYNKYSFSKYTKDKIIKAGSFLIIKGEKGFNFALSSNDEIKLKNPNNAEVDKIAYSGAKENISYSFNERDNKWHWSEFLTPGGVNLFKEVGEIVVNIDKDIYRDIYADFEVGVGGIDAKKLKVKWEFGDTKKSYLAKARHKYKENGKYLVRLTVFNGSEDIIKEFNIEVEDFPQKKVSIVGIVPNPIGKDTEKEWIEIKNKSHKKVNLKNWSVATGGDKKKLVNHPIKEDFIIKAGKIKQLTREFSKFSLNNKKGYIELRYPDGEVAYKLKYKKEDGAGDDEIYRKKEGGGWEWILDKNLTIKKVANEDEGGKEITSAIEKEEGELDLVKEILPEDVGKVSQEINAENISIGKILKQNLLAHNEEVANISRDNSYVLGAWDDKIKKTREEEGIYYFNPKVKSEKNYWMRLLENVF